MKYVRSRPWGTRGPWFSNRAASRRRGHYEAPPLDPGDEFVDDAWAEPAAKWEPAASGAEPLLGSALLAPSVTAPPSAASFYPGRIDESGLRELARHARKMEQEHMPIPEPPGQNALEAFSTILRRRDATTPPGRRSA